MSAVPLRLPEPTPGSHVETARRILRLVPRRRSQAAKTPFAVVLVVLLVGGLLGLLLLNTLVAQGSFALHDLSRQGRALQQQEQQLSDQVQALQDPAALASRATKLGMVPGGAPAFLRLPDGRVLGVPTAGQALPKPAPPKPTPTSASTTSANPSASTTWTAPRPTGPTKAPNKTATGAHR